MTPLTKPGQIRAGAHVSFHEYGKHGRQHRFVDAVLNPGTAREEILLDPVENLYFIVSMAIEGTSWAKDVQFENNGQP